MTQTLTDRVQAALLDAARVADWELFRQTLKVRRFSLPDGRGGDACELVVVPYRRWRHWRQTKAGRKGGPIAGQLWRERNGEPDNAA